MNTDPEKHGEDCDHDRPLLDAKGAEIHAFDNGGNFIAGSARQGTCAECGATLVCVGCRSSDGECYCE